jgi:phage-related protein
VSEQTAQEINVMQQLFNQLLQFLQQGISAIFRFVQMIWTWSVGQISSLVRVPWQDWPLWKQILLVLIVAGIAWALYKVAKELWEAGERILAAFATLLGVLIRTLPSVIIAGLIALAGLWVLNNVDLGRMPLPTFLQTTSVDRR